MRHTAGVFHRRQPGGTLLSEEPGQGAGDVPLHCLEGHAANAREAGWRELAAAFRGGLRRGIGHSVPWARWRR